VVSRLQRWERFGGTRYTFFVRTILENEAYFCSEFKNNPSLSRKTKSQILILEQISIQVVNKTAAVEQLANSILLHVIHVQLLQLSLREYKLKLHIAYLTSWHTSIFLL